MARRRTFMTDPEPEPDTADVPDTPTPAPTRPAAPPAVAAPKGIKVLLRDPKGKAKPRAHYLPEGEKIAFRICVDGQYYEHVAEDEAGCWVYTRS